MISKGFYCNKKIVKQFDKFDEFLGTKVHKSKLKLAVLCSMPCFEFFGYNSVLILAKVLFQSTYVFILSCYAS